MGGQKRLPRLESISATTVKLGHVVRFDDGSMREIRNMFALADGRKRLLFADGSEMTLATNVRLPAYRAGDPQ